MKKILVKSCSDRDCEFHYYGADGKKCLLEARELTQEDEEQDFPEWCPLEDE